MKSKDPAFNEVKKEIKIRLEEKAIEEDIHLSPNVDLPPQAERKIILQLMAIEHRTTPWLNNTGIETTTSHSCTLQAAM